MIDQTEKKKNNKNKSPQVPVWVSDQVQREGITRSAKGDDDLWRLKTAPSSAAPHTWKTASDTWHPVSHWGGYLHERAPWTTLTISTVFPYQQDGGEKKNSWSPSFYIAPRASSCLGFWAAFFKITCMFPRKCASKRWLTIPCSISEGK